MSTGGVVPRQQPGLCRRPRPRAACKHGLRLRVLTPGAQTERPSSPAPHLQAEDLTPCPFPPASSAQPSAGVPPDGVTPQGQFPEFTGLAHPLLPPQPPTGGAASPPKSRDEDPCPSPVSNTRASAFRSRRWPWPGADPGGACP